MNRFGFQKDLLWLLCRNWIGGGKEVSEDKEEAITVASEMLVAGTEVMAKGWR